MTLVIALALLITFTFFVSRTPVHYRPAPPATTRSNVSE